MVCTVAMLIPFFWMVGTSFKPANEAYGGGLWFLPKTLSLDGYAQVFQQTPFLQWMLNSVIVSVVLTIGQAAIALLAAFVFVRYSFFGRNALFYFVLATMIIPPQVMMIPTFLMVNALGWMDTLTAIIVPQLASGYAIFLMRQFLLRVPRELADAAEVDGCKAVRILWHVYVPAAVPGLIALCVILFVGHWNDYYWPLVVLMSDEHFTLPIALVKFQHDGLIDLVPTMAVSTLSSLPVLIIYFFSQRRFLESFTHTGLNG